MGFGGFGKKAREFDLEKLAEQTRMEAMERNKCNIGEPFYKLVNYLVLD